jgi:hypothetical protein
LDRFENVCTRAVKRPRVMANYFAFSNCIDRHNQLRQGELALEKWATRDCWFRLYSTMLGIEVVDVFTAAKAMVIPSHPLKTMSVKRMADILVRSLLEDKEPVQIREPECRCPTRAGLPIRRKTTAAGLEALAAEARRQTRQSQEEEDMVMPLEVEPHGVNALVHTCSRSTIGQRACAWCRSLPAGAAVQTKTSYVCEECCLPLCNTEREDDQPCCFDMHVLHGKPVPPRRSRFVAPAAKKSKTD